MVKRQKILASNTFLRNQTTQTDDLKAKFAVFREKDKITSLKKEVKSIFHCLADDHIRLKSVEDKILEAQTDLESHEKLYKFFRANPPF
jgi:hypothetical protein